MISKHIIPTIIWLFSIAMSATGMPIGGAAGAVKAGGVFSGAIGVASTIGVSYASGVNPWTGEFLIPKYIDLNKSRAYDFSPDPYGDNVSLYRGITGSENGNGPLFMTDNPEYAASYVANGGKVVKVTIPRSTLNQIYHEGLLNYYNGIHINGSNYIEYKFAPNIKPAIVSKFKY